LTVWYSAAVFLSKRAKQECCVVLILSVFCLSSISVYIAALRAGMAEKRWALVALCLGPLVLPLFHNHKRLTLRRAFGRFSNFF
jgi:hypothetical protein